MFNGGMVWQACEQHTMRMSGKPRGWAVAWLLDYHCVYAIETLDECVALQGEPYNVMCPLHRSPERRTQPAPSPSDPTPHHNQNQPQQQPQTVLGKLLGEISTSSHFGTLDRTAAAASDIMIAALFCMLGICATAELMSSATMVSLATHSLAGSRNTQPPDDQARRQNSSSHVVDNVRHQAHSSQQVRNSCVYVDVLGESH